MNKIGYFVQDGSQVSCYEKDQCGKPESHRLWVKNEDGDWYIIDETELIEN